MSKCAICESEVRNRNSRYKTCGHPRCINQYRRQKPSRDAATRASRPRHLSETLPRLPQHLRAMSDVKSRQAITDFMRAALARGADFSSAVTDAAYSTGHSPAVVMSVWKSVN